ncbi:hypothetical protein TNIN_394181 [Trichonephila inaurata madagascariensis]|uniref:Uncharacterized protein n=1 Tax=Trichonephila inaurata madagascariensis TaxID=2747483 RepID=A0A8X6Y8C7_9ARAC|nr:hypothetical protein TNIN_394181 [Trichonephila inaurata madagascariensis]
MDGEQNSPPSGQMDVTLGGHEQPKVSDHLSSFHGKTCQKLEWSRLCPEVSRPSGAEWHATPTPVASAYPKYLYRGKEKINKDAIFRVTCIPPPPLTE